MSALRRVTAPPIELAEAVTNSLRQDANRNSDVCRNSNTFRVLNASHKTAGFFNVSPPVLRSGRDGVLMPGISTAIPLSFPILSGIPL
ncbi:hypothetical protein HNQ77_004026 [Silvibacterium bohemicum]|uniref:Uncharacterized protein n=1 Tax=Silvibacterium bohemicum TaxID=1577686 RepID=A0A841JXG7_9BACT|nr:hypothetical protein [Silvibacterium bohemicum]